MKPSVWSGTEVRCYHIYHTSFEGGGCETLLNQSNLLLEMNIQVKTEEGLSVTKRLDRRCIGGCEVDK